MSKYVHYLDKLTKKQEEELQKLTDEMMDLSTEIVEDYEETPSELSGSTIQIHESSPFLYEWLKGDKWKKILSYIPFKSNKNDTK